MDSESSKILGKVYNKRGGTVYAPNPRKRGVLEDSVYSVTLKRIRAGSEADLRHRLLQVRSTTERAQAQLRADFGITLTILRLGSNDPMCMHSKVAAVEDPRSCVYT